MLAFPERIRRDEINYDNALKATLPKGGLILDAVLDGVSREIEEMLT